MEGQIRKKAKLIYGNGQNGFTVEEALTKAADDETAIYATTENKRSNLTHHHMLRKFFPALVLNSLT